MKSPDMAKTNRVAMTRVKRRLKNQKLRGKQKGLTMVEYAVAGSLITLGCVAAFTSLGEAIADAITTMIGYMGGGG